LPYQNGDKAKENHVKLLCKKFKNKNKNTQIQMANEVIS
jgi:hypothetical protein